VPKPHSGRGKSFSYRVPSDTDSDDEVTSSRRLSAGICIQPGRELIAPQQRSQQELQLASEASSKITGRLREIDRLLAQELERVELDLQEKQVRRATPASSSLCSVSQRGPSSLARP
jgi:hypothetical protein